MQGDDFVIHVRQKKNLRFSGKQKRNKNGAEKKRINKLTNQMKKPNEYETGRNSSKLKFEIKFEIKQVRN